MEISVEKYLKELRETADEQTWQTEVKRLVKQAIKTGPKHQIFWKELTKDFEWLDWKALQQEAEQEMGISQKSEAEVEEAATEPLAYLLRKEMPGIRSQGQYDAILGAMNALKIVLNAIMERDRVKEAKAQEALEMALNATRMATELTYKLREVPEAVTSKMADTFKQPPLQFQEYAIQRQLLKELESIETMEKLNTWYAETKEKRDQIVTQGLRNTLLDSIRSKKNILR